jgi:transposase
VATLAVTRRFDLSDAQWQRLEPLLPVGKGPGRPSRWTKRQLVDGIRWRVRVGSPWRDVPEGYGSWRAVYGLFRRWQRAGVWAAIMTGLQADADAAGLITWEVSVDSTIARAHQHAAGARRHPSQQQEPPGGLSIEPDALGRSRGGLTTKIHLACEQGPEGAVPDPDRRRRGDSPQFRAVLDGINLPRIGAGRPRTRPDKVRADKAYSSLLDPCCCGCVHVGAGPAPRLQRRGWPMSGQLPVQRRGLVRSLVHAVLMDVPAVREMA